MTDAVLQLPLPKGTPSERDRWMFLCWHPRSTRTQDNLVKVPPPLGHREHTCARVGVATAGPWQRPGLSVGYEGPSWRFSRRDTLSQTLSRLAVSPNLESLDLSELPEDAPQTGAPSVQSTTGSSSTDSTPEYLVRVRPRILHCYGFSGLSAYGGPAAKSADSDDPPRLRRVRVSSPTETGMRSTVLRRDPGKKHHDALRHRGAFPLRAKATQVATCANP